MRQPQPSQSLTLMVSPRYPEVPDHIYCMRPRGPHPEPRLGWNVVSLAPSSFVYFLPCTQALLEPLPFSILEPNSNKAVTSDPGPCCSLPPAQRSGWATPGWAEGPDQFPPTGAWTSSLPSPRQMSQRSVSFITKILLRKQNQCCKWNRKELGLPPTRFHLWERRGWGLVPHTAHASEVLGRFRNWTTCLGSLA